MRGITLEEIAESTKIGTRSLRALEGEDFDKLPGGIFNKGFVRAYAKYLGIDEEQAVTDFMAAFGEFQQQQPASTTPETPAVEESPLSLNVLVVGGAIVLLVLIFAAWRFHEPIAGAASRIVHREKPAAAAQMPSTVAAAPNPAPAAPAAAPLDTPSTPAASNSPAGVPGAARTTPAATSQNPTLSGASTVTSAVAALPGEFVLQIRARQDSWVSITADDKVLMQGTLKGEKTIRAKNKVVLTTGNAGAVELSFNGQPQPTLGAGNQVKTVVFTPDGLQR